MSRTATVPALALPGKIWSKSTKKCVNMGNSAAEAALFHAFRNLPPQPLSLYTSSNISLSFLADFYAHICVLRLRSLRGRDCIRRHLLRSGRCPGTSEQGNLCVCPCV